MSSTSRTPASEATTERLAWDAQRLRGLRCRRWFVIAKPNFFPSLVTSARLAFTLPASLSLHSLPSQSFSWLHLAPFLPASFEGKKCVLFAAAPVCGLRLAYTFPSTSPSARSGANSILPINSPRPFLRDSKSLSTDCRSSPSLEIDPDTLPAQPAQLSSSKILKYF
jgi:hypothetical protein